MSEYQIWELDEGILSHSFNETTVIYQILLFIIEPVFGICLDRFSDAILTDWFKKKIEITHYLFSREETVFVSIGLSCVKKRDLKTVNTYFILTLFLMEQSKKR